MPHQEDPKRILAKIKILKDNAWGAVKQAASRLPKRGRTAGKWVWKHWKREVICYSVLAGFILALFGGFAVYTEVVYQKGVELFEKEQYEAAVKQFKETVDYKNAGEYLSLCQQSLVYERAGALMEDGSFHSARHLYLSLGDFKDAATRADWCYTLASYPDLKQRLTTVGEMLDTRDKQLEDARIHLKSAYAAANRLMAEGDLLAAYDAFTVLGDYNGASSKARIIQKRYYQEQNILQVDFSPSENGEPVHDDYLKDPPAFQFFEGETEVKEETIGGGIDGYRIPDGRIIFTDMETGNLYLLSDSGNKTLLLAGHRDENTGEDQEDFDQKSACFIGMIDEHRFIYKIRAYRDDYVLGVYDLSSGMNHRLNTNNEPWMSWFPRKIVDNQLYFAGGYDYEPGFKIEKIGKLDLNSYSFTKTELTSFGFEVGCGEPICRYFITDFDISPDGTKVVFMGNKNGRPQGLICSLTQQNIIRTFTIVYPYINYYYTVVYHTDDEVFLYISPYSEGVYTGKILYIIGSL